MGRLKLSLKEGLTELGDCLDGMLEGEVGLEMSSRLLVWAEMSFITMIKISQMKQTVFCSGGKFICASVVIFSLIL